MHFAGRQGAGEGAAGGRGARRKVRRRGLALARAWLTPPQEGSDLRHQAERAHEWRVLGVQVGGQA